MQYVAALLNKKRMPFTQAFAVWLLILLYGIVFYMPPWTMLAPSPPSARQANLKHKTLNHNNNNHTNTTPLMLKPRPFFIIGPKPNA